jgi:hypothetical protein
MTLKMKQIYLGYWDKWYLPIKRLLSFIGIFFCPVGKEEKSCVIKVEKFFKSATHLHLFPEFKFLTKT